MMTGSGMEMGFLGSFGMAWLGLVVLTFIIMFAKKWLAEEGGMPFSWIFAAIGTGLGYIITETLSCSFKLALLIGLVGMIVGGFGVGYFIGGGEEY